MTKKLTVMIFGAGRMGDIVTGSICKKNHVVIYDQDEKKGREIAEKYGCRYGFPEKELPKMKVIVLALPPAVTVSALSSLRQWIQPETVVINIATTIGKDLLRLVVPHHCHWVGAKIVGHYREMREMPAIIVDADTDYGRDVAANLFSGLGNVIFGDEQIVSYINTLATQEAFRCAVQIENQLMKAGISPELIKSALKVVAAGSIKSYAEGDIGPFAQELLKEIRLESGNR